MFFQRLIHRSLSPCFILFVYQVVISSFLRHFLGKPFGYRLVHGFSLPRLTPQKCFGRGAIHQKRERISLFAGTALDGDFYEAVSESEKGVGSDHGTLASDSSSTAENNENEDWDDYFRKKKEIEDGLNSDEKEVSLGVKNSLQDEMDVLTERLGQQQQQIENLVKYIKTIGDDKISKITTQDGSTDKHSTSVQATAIVPLKAMMFIDGTWLYYSLYGRDAGRCPIRQEYGHGWHQRYDVNWSLLPKIVCEALNDRGWSSLPVARPTEIVRACVFTSYKADTLSSSLRYQLFEDMEAANYDVHLMETVGKSEKCVDIQLAVEMLHYATVPDAYDIAIILTGDKDFLPALKRTRQKGRKVALVSMRSGCNRALKEANGIKDFDVIWLEDCLDKLLTPRQGRGADVGDIVSVFTVAKVIKDYIDQSGGDVVNSRDVGRYLQCLSVGKDSLLDKVRSSFGGLGSFVAVSDIFEAEDRPALASDSRNQGSGFWIKLLPDAGQQILKRARSTQFMSDEKKFFESYDTSMLKDKQTAYYYTLLDRGEDPDAPSFATISNDIIPSVDYSTFTVAQLKELCRDRGLSMSGLKSALLDRVLESSKQEMEEAQTQSSFWLHRPHKDSTPPKVTEEAASYLQEIVQEYLSAAGGTASSRDIGRYLQANKSSSGRSSSEDSALKELKREYGTLSRFVDFYPDFYSRDNEGGEEHAFLVTLRSRG